MHTSGLRSSLSAHRTQATIHSLTDQELESNYELRSISCFFPGSEVAGETKKDTDEVVQSHTMQPLEQQHL